jgi:hypothetical protein
VLYTLVVCGFDMAATWFPNQSASKIYDDEQQHSDGMISFAYRPPSTTTQDPLEDVNDPCRDHQGRQGS